MSTLFMQVFLSVFPCKFRTAAYTTIHNEHHGKSTAISWSSGVSAQKKKEGKTSREPQIQNYAGRETWSLTVKLLLTSEAVLLSSVGAASWHISRQWWRQDSSKNGQLHAHREPKPTEWVPSREGLYLRDPRLQGNKALCL